MTRPDSTSGSGSTRLVISSSSSAAIRRGVCTDGLHVNELDRPALLQRSVGTVASLDAELPRRVVNCDDSIPLLNRQRRGDRDTQAYMLYLMAAVARGASDLAFDNSLDFEIIAPAADLSVPAHTYT